MKRIKYLCLLLMAISFPTFANNVTATAENIQIELEWLILDTGFELQVLFKGADSNTKCDTFVFS